MRKNSIFIHGLVILVTILILARMLYVIYFATHSTSEILPTVTRLIASLTLVLCLNTFNIIGLYMNIIRENGVKKNLSLEFRE